MDNNERTEPPKYVAKVQDITVAAAGQLGNCLSTVACKTFSKDNTWEMCHCPDEKMEGELVKAETLDLATGNIKDTLQKECSNHFSFQFSQWNCRLHNSRKWKKKEEDVFKNALEAEQPKPAVPNKTEHCFKNKHLQLQTAPKKTGARQRRKCKKRTKNANAVQFLANVSAGSASQKSKDSKKTCKHIPKHQDDCLPACFFNQSHILWSFNNQLAEHAIEATFQLNFCPHTDTTLTFTGHFDKMSSPGPSADCVSGEECFDSLVHTACCHNCASTAKLPCGDKVFHDLTRNWPWVPPKFSSTF